MDDELTGLTPEQVHRNIRDIHLDIANLFTAQQQTVDQLKALTDAVNTVGAMMNQASEAINGLFNQFQQGGGLMGILGALKGGKNG